jgi:hypothetical protein
VLGRTVIENKKTTEIKMMQQRTCYIEAGGEAVDVANVQEERVAGETTLEQRNRATFARLIGIGEGEWVRG